MVKKKVDSRIRTLIENGLTTHHRSLFFLIGDHARDQIVNLHYILTKSAVKAKPSVLWAYKKDLGFTSHRQKRMRKLKKDIARGIRSAEDSETPFELFVGSTDIRYAYYRETDRILGNTYQMLVLQDFHALTPNLLARTIETVEGGGIIVVLLKTMTSLRQLYTMTMDVHARYRTEGSGEVVGRFNERFLLSLAKAGNCLVLDDELNVLPISSHVRDIQKAIAPTLTPTPADSTTASAATTLATRSFTSLNQKHLYDLQLSMRDTQPIGSLLDCCRTLDQAKAVLSFSEAISEKTLRSTVVLTAARGRGKSAALGLSVAAAIAYGYSNVFITAPSPENVKTLFDLILRGFAAMEYKEHTDYDVITSTAAEHNHAVVRINVYHSHRQTVQYIAPSDAAALSQAELLVIDEAAAIPLPMVRALMGPYLVFMASTVNGYEGTGRSLALKLVKQLRQQAVNTQQSTAAGELNGATASTAVTSSATSSASATGGRTLREITLDEPIRYSPDDPIEAWLNDLLCLNCTQNVPRLTGGVPHPSQCELYYVERDTLFSSHRASESFLHRMMALYVSSHYKNSPNDLQLMSDAPGHHLFVLLPPQSASTGALPDILAVVQVCLEGQISKASIAASLGRGERAAGDLIPWCVSQQFGSGEFGQLSGARVVRVAVHPEVQRMGYGKRAMQLLVDYYQGKYSSPLPITKIKPKSSTSTNHTTDDSATTNGDSSLLLTETVAPRKSLPPLLQSLTDVPPPSLHYIGVSFGLTSELFSFWSKLSFLPLYVRLTPNALTGEHTCIMLRGLRGDSAGSGSSGVVVRSGMEMRDGWLREFVSDFRRRFVSLLSYQFTNFSSALALSVLKEGEEQSTTDTPATAAASDSSPANSLSNSAFERWSSFRPIPVTFRELCVLLTEFDLRRLESYADNLVDYHLVLDLLPLLAGLLFTGRLVVGLSFTQQAILLALGLQHKDVEVVGRELGLGVQQVLAQFNKSVRKISTWMREEVEKGKRQEADKDKRGEKRTRLAAAQPVNGHKKQKASMEEETAGDEEEEVGGQDGTELDEDAEDEGEDGADEQHPRPLGLPLGRSMDAELESAALKVKEELRDKQRALLSSADMQQYAIRGGDEKWEQELKAMAATGGRVSIQTDQKVEGKRKVVHENTNSKRKSGGAGIGGVKSSSGKKRKVKQ